VLDCCRAILGNDTGDSRDETFSVENVRSAMSEEWLMLQHFSNPHHPHCGKMMKSSLSFSMTLCVDNIDFKIFSLICVWPKIIIKVTRTELGREDL
jgi:hypothetical protein